MFCPFITGEYVNILDDASAVLALLIQIWYDGGMNYIGCRNTLTSHLLVCIKSDRHH
jgi:hypothetical protein